MWEKMLGDQKLKVLLLAPAQIIVPGTRPNFFFVIYAADAVYKKYIVVYVRQAENKNNALESFIYSDVLTDGKTPWGKRS